MIKGNLFIVLFVLISIHCYAQTGARKEKNPFHKAYHDSLKKMDYNYALPLLGKKAYKKGFDIQFPYGVGLAYFVQRQKVVIDNISITLNNSAPIDLTSIIEFGDIENVSMATSVRPNFWILPFLNLYGVFATGTSSTAVPLVKPINFKTTQNFTATTAGVGATLAGGFGPVLVIIDQNYNWVNLDAFVEPVPAYNLDMRLAHNFVNPVRADRSATLWVGAFYQQINADTKGTIKVSDIFPGIPQEKKDEYKQDFDQWYNSLNPIQQALVQPVINDIKGFFDGLNPGNSVIGYQLNKRLAGPWNLIFGAQYQHNKYWQVRMEMGTFGQRSQFLLNLSYCFLGLKHKR